MQRLEVTVCRVLDLGLTPYRQARELQEQLAVAIGRGQQPPTLMLLEHPHTFTFGRRGRQENLLWDEATCAARQVDVVWVDRGGDVTYHGPGQLVGYPLIPLGRLDSSGRLPQADYLGFVRRLEQVLIVALARLGLASGQQPGLTGVWVQPDVASRCRRCPPAARRTPAKIAAIGVKVDAAGITRHGFALNVSPDMDYWDGIVACGLADHPVVSLDQLMDPAPPMDRVRREVADAFGEVFGMEIVDSASGIPTPRHAGAGMPSGGGTSPSFPGRT
jgi:lipoate-protein ligase B